MPYAPARRLDGSAIRARMDNAARWWSSPAARLMPGHCGRALSVRSANRPAGAATRGDSGGSDVFDRLRVELARGPDTRGLATELAAECRTGQALRCTRRMLVLPEVAPNELEAAPAGSLGQIEIPDAGNKHGEVIVLTIQRYACRSFSSSGAAAAPGCSSADDTGPRYRSATSNVRGAAGGVRVGRRLGYPLEHVAQTHCSLGRVGLVSR